MTAARDLEVFKSFDIGQATVSLWVFKKRSVTGDMNPFTAVSVLMSDTLRVQLKELVHGYQKSHTTSEEYSLLAQCAEGTFLSVPFANTLFSSLQTLADQPCEEHLVKHVKQLNNAAGYVFRLRFGEQIIYCVKKTTSDWATRKKNGVMNILFKEACLEVIDEPSFSIARMFDFFVAGEHVLMSNKASFESLLSHKISYEEDYTALKQEPEFAAVIADIVPMNAYVGTNTTQLRRMTVIRARGYYKNTDYLARLKTVNATRNWGIAFDDQGRIVPTAETMRAIMQALLDHRLRSELSENQYDVPSTSLVS